LHTGGAGTNVRYTFSREIDLFVEPGASAVNIAFELVGAFNKYWAIAPPRGSP